MALPGKAAAKFGGLKAGKTAPPPDETEASTETTEAAVEPAAAAPAPKKTRKPRQHPEQTDAAAAAPAASADTELEMTVPGEFAPVRISGHFRDVAEAVTRLLQS